MVISCACYILLGSDAVLLGKLKSGEEVSLDGSYDRKEHTHIFSKTDIQ